MFEIWERNNDKKSLILVLMLSFSLLSLNANVNEEKSVSIEEVVKLLNNAKVQYSDGGVCIFPEVSTISPIIIGSLFILAGFWFHYASLGLNRRRYSKNTDELVATLVDQIPMLLSLFFGICKFMDGLKKSSIKSKPILILDKDGFSYQGNELFGDPAYRYLSWSDVEEINIRPNTNRDVAARANQSSDSIFVSESILPISFEEFYDIVVPYFWSEQEKAENPAGSDH